MDNAIQISVVIPSKNRAHTLPRCLDSILAQSYPVKEIIVVDDDSTDNIKEVVDSYSDRCVIYTRLTQGKGAQVARNYGVEIARYEWIAFQDSDDIWLPNKIAIQIDALSSCRFDKTVVVHGDFIKRDDTTGREQRQAVPLTEGSCYEQLLVQSAPMFQALLASKEMILRAGGLDNKCPSYQEWDTAIRLSKYCKFIHIKQPLFIWVWHAGETISKDVLRDILGFDYVIKSHKEEIINVHGISGWRKMKIKTILRALRAGLWSEVENILIGESWHHSYLLAKVFVKIRFFPRGASRLLMYMAK
jgi:glycosyltransferase involved in cell wall biosynthesis